ncbi:hypothetical protein PSP6_800008 [Paraburkholderia tropica]|nr:hypothetical protein PSP6_800008 [Paraburkholderia tropica]
MYPSPIRPEGGPVSYPQADALLGSPVLP